MFDYTLETYIIVTLLILLITGFMCLDCNFHLKFYETFLPNKHRLDGKTVWIVGSSTGRVD